MLLGDPGPAGELGQGVEALATESMRDALPPYPVVAVEALGLDAQQLSMCVQVPAVCLGATAAPNPTSHSLR